MPLQWEPCSICRRNGGLLVARRRHSIRRRNSGPDAALVAEPVHQVTRTCGRKEKHMETLLQILNELHPDVDFTAENALIDDGVLDSLDIVTLITEINDKFDVEIPAEEILPENFNSAKALYALIQRIDEE